VVSDVLAALQSLVDDERLGAAATAIEGPAVGMRAVLDATGVVIAGSLPGEIAADVGADAVTFMETERSGSLEYGKHRVFIEVIAPRPRLVIVGAVEAAEALSTMAGIAGYHVTVADPRPAFTTPERFPDADEVLVGQPEQLGLSFGRHSFLVVLSHDARIEDGVLPEALRSPARYIGAMGSRRTHRLRLERLERMGFGAEDLDRIHGPVGLDIGAETPAEVAVSILAEMVMARYEAGSGRSLRGTEGRIHARREGDADL
jgi:xanthine dehydrogenase accessory factor